MFAGGTSGAIGRGRDGVVVAAPGDEARPDARVAQHERLKGLPVHAPGGIEEAGDPSRVLELDDPREVLGLRVAAFEAQSDLRRHPRRLPVCWVPAQPRLLPDSPGVGDITG
ncbi:MAG TPA: hypothetical protein DEP45_13555 [Armatimonadetes bacterium]|nr:hypothetical protein [Armatimonadota bacterium]